MCALTSYHDVSNIRARKMVLPGLYSTRNPLGRKTYSSSVPLESRLSLLLHFVCGLISFNNILRYMKLYFMRYIRVTWVALQTGDELGEENMKRK
jgi:hypothetical protein